jgi:hypothetical protein
MCFIVAQAAQSLEFRNYLGFELSNKNRLKIHRLIKIAFWGYITMCVEQLGAIKKKGKGEERRRKRLELALLAHDRGCCCCFFVNKKGIPASQEHSTMQPHLG